MEYGHDEMRGNGQELSKTHTLTLRSFQLFREIWVETANSPHYFSNSQNDVRTVITGDKSSIAFHNVSAWIPHHNTIILFADGAPQSINGVWMDGMRLGRWLKKITQKLMCEICRYH